MSAVGTAWVSTAPAQFLFYFTDFPSPFGQNSMNSYKSYRGPGVRPMPSPSSPREDPGPHPPRGLCLCSHLCLPLLICVVCGAYLPTWDAQGSRSYL